MATESGEPYHFETVGIVHSPYKEKFAVPRQPGLVPAAQGRIELLPPYSQKDCLRDLEQFSHLWVLFVFHGTREQGWKPLVRPPRLGGNQKTGVFATRSTFRPNPIGMSVVTLERVGEKGGHCWLEISGFDLLDQTPVVDIKPYLPYCDSIADATGGFASHKPEADVQVLFSPEAERQSHQAEREFPQFKEFIRQVLSQDPRPAYRRQNNTDSRTYGVRLHNHNITWQVADGTFWVTAIESHQ